MRDGQKRLRSLAIDGWGFSWEEIGACTSSCMSGKPPHMSGLIERCKITEISVI